MSSGKDAERRLAISQSALDDLMGDANSLRKLSGHDQDTLDEYLQSVRETEIRVEKARRWLDIPMPQIDVSHLNLDVTPDDPRNYVQTMYELIYLAFRTDSTGSPPGKLVAKTVSEPVTTWRALLVIT